MDPVSGWELALARVKAQVPELVSEPVLATDQGLGLVQAPGLEPGSVREPVLEMDLALVRVQAQGKAPASERDPVSGWEPVKEQVWGSEPATDQG